MNREDFAENLFEKMDALQVAPKDQIFAYLLLVIAEHLSEIEESLLRIAEFFEGDKP